MNELIPHHPALTEKERSAIIARIQTALDELDVAVKQHNPIAVVGMLSGGNDSLACCKVASMHPAFSGILHINTGIGVEQTREFVRETCAANSWHLWEYRAWDNRQASGKPDPMVYREIVKQHGFPGPAGHQFMYNRLKERPLRMFERDMNASARGKVKRRIMLITGARIQESSRRKMNVSPDLVQQIDGRRIWVNLIRAWSKRDCAHLRWYFGMCENEVSKNIHKSGECLCGAFAKPGELEELRMFYPETAAEIDSIAAEARACGKHDVWGTRPPGRRKGGKTVNMPLCTSCILPGLEPQFTVIKS